MGMTKHQGANMDSDTITAAGKRMAVIGESFRETKESDLDKYLFQQESPFFAPSNLLEESALHADAIVDNSIDLTVTSPPYNVGLKYDSKTDDSATYLKYLEFSR